MTKKDSLFHDKRFLITISLLASFLLWIYISTVLRSTGETTVKGIGVNINVQSGILGQMGLSAIEGGETTVDVVISGTRTVIGGVLAEDISVTPSLSGVSGAGVYTLDLVADNVSGKSFDILSVSPSTISVKFDKYVDKTLPLVYVVDGEYNVPDEYIQGDIYVSPSEIIVSGPEKDLAGISKAVVYAELNGDYTETTALTGAIVLSDENGNEINYNPEEIRLNTSSATVYLPIYRTKELPVYFKFTNVPDFFDTDTVQYTLSTGSVLVEGEGKTLDKYNDLFLGYLDIRSVTSENNSFIFDVSLPEGIRSMDNTTKVQVNFELDDYESLTLRTDQIQILNVPKGYSAKSNANQLAVKIFGPADVIHELTKKDVIAQIDLSERDITQTGQYRMQVNVLLPGGQPAWAIGSYSITVTIKEN